ncbi:gluconokinase [Dyella acidiphila]|uniref:Gluconokinase n=1 Tax=Dyella acidiphila TaxID=2775866 RepID=A0ABR9G591_9GAMM|nr:gluconokinase [Dyella acidiphila]MBE1159227.1 gluconokinase [Dyella acidiphila]
MGVSGSGKSTVAGAIRDRACAVLIEGDDFHSPQNIHKMHSGTPLNDADRQGWLERIAQETNRQLATAPRVLVACSALKRRYRDMLRQAIPELGFVFLDLSEEEARARVSQRTDHFMPSSLVESQFRDLEPPQGEPRVLTVSASKPAAAIADLVIAWWPTA